MLTKQGMQKHSEGESWDKQKPKQNNRKNLTASTGKKLCSLSGKRTHNSFVSLVSRTKFLMWTWPVETFS